MDVVWPRVRRGDFLHNAIFPDCPGKSVMVSCLSLSLKMRWAGKELKFQCKVTATPWGPLNMPPRCQLRAPGNREAQPSSRTASSANEYHRWFFNTYFVNQSPQGCSIQETWLHTLVRALDKDGAGPGPQHRRLSSGWLWCNVQHFGGGFPWAYQRVRSSSMPYMTRSFQLTFAVPLVDYVSSLVPLMI